MPKAIGIAPEDLIQMIDHLVPLCALLDSPLLCFDRLNYELILADYPPMQVFLAEENPYEILDNYDTLLYTSAYRHGPFGFAFSDFIYDRPMRSVCSLHGQSDKKQDQFWLERLVDEDIVLLYGESLIDTLKHKQIFSRIHSPLIMGNLRAHFYQKHKRFFDEKVPKWIRGKKNILYAPTWHAPYPDLQDRKESSSFFVVSEKLFDTVPDHFQLIVKLHPLLLCFFPDEVMQLKQKYRKKENVFFLERFPLVYPLLNQIDIYIGDHSSVGYDFLYFDRPMFFINHNNQNNPLFKGGQIIEPEEIKMLDALIEKEEKNKNRKSLYSYAFDQSVCYDTLKNQIMEALCKKSPY